MEQGDDARMSVDLARPSLEQLARADYLARSHGETDGESSITEEELSDLASVNVIIQEKKMEATTDGTDEHLLSIAEIGKKYDVDLDENDPGSTPGLSNEECEKRIGIYGLNKLDPPKQTPLIIQFFKQFLGLFSLMLEAAGVLCFVSAGLTKQLETLFLGIILWLVVIVSALFNFHQLRKSTKVLKSFDNLVPSVTIAIRNGKQSTIKAENLVPGDVIRIKGGDKVPADIRLITCNNLKVDNSTLTGESEPQTLSVTTKEKNPLEASNLMYMGTLCLEGEGLALVYKTGENTLLGGTAKLASEVKQTFTRLQMEIHSFVRWASIAGIVTGLIVLIVSLATKVHWLDSVLAAIGAIVSIVPEGLQLTVTIALTLTATKMGKKNVLVKKLSIVETLGSTSVICSDKTGTLTQNKMTTSYLVYNQQIYTCANLTSVGHFDDESNSCRKLIKAMTLCNRAVYEISPENQEKTVIGDASETALLKFVDGIVDVDKERLKHRKLAEIPFNSTIKYQLSIHKENDGPLLIMKGAPEQILRRCSQIMTEEGETALTDDDRQKIDSLLGELADLGQRVLGFAELKLDRTQFPENFKYDINQINFPMEGLVFVGFSALYDPPKDGVPECIETCKGAGIRVVMVTGDHPATARAIARQIGIISCKTSDEISSEYPDKTPAELRQIAGAVVIEGQQISTLTNDDWDTIISKNEIVFARTSPEQKLRIVGQFQSRGFVTAVTGDGVNDAPALRKADVGVAMGKNGSEVAKEAADILLMDDHFPSILTGISQGRLVFDNLKKSIAYALSAKLPEVLPFLLFVIIGIPLPLTTVLVLCIDIGTDLIPGISFAYEKPERDIMKRPPRNPTKHKLVNLKLLFWSTIVIGTIQAASGFTAYFLIMYQYGFPPSSLPFTARKYFNKNAPSYFVNGIEMTVGDQMEALAMAQTAFFTSIMLTQLADCLICKTRYLTLFQHQARNYVQFFGMLLAVTVGICFAYVPIFHDVLGTAPIGWRHWLQTLPFSVFLFLFDEGRKLIIRRFKKRGITKFMYW